MAAFRNVPNADFHFRPYYYPYADRQICGNINKIDHLLKIFMLLHFQ